jgi:hypothetical protein
VPAIRTDGALPVTSISTSPARLLPALDFQHLATVLFEYPVYDTPLVKQRTQGQQVLLNIDAEGGVKLGHQLTRALLQRSLSLQLA